LVPRKPKANASVDDSVRAKVFCFFFSKKKTFLSLLCADRQSISYQLQACASQGSDSNGTYYVSAADGPTLTSALQKFLKQALNAPARFTQ
jgi:hypothetical protein